MWAIDGREVSRLTKWIHPKPFSRMPAREFGRRRRVVEEEYIDHNRCAAIFKRMHTLSTLSSHQAQGLASCCALRILVTVCRDPSTRSRAAPAPGRAAPAAAPRLCDQATHLKTPPSGSSPFSLHHHPSPPRTTRATAPLTTRRPSSGRHGQARGTPASRHPARGGMGTRRMRSWCTMISRTTRIRRRPLMWRRSCDEVGTPG